MKDTWEKIAGNRSYYFRVENRKVLVADNNLLSNPHTQIAGYLEPLEFKELYQEIFLELFGEKELGKIIKLLQL